MAEEPWQTHDKRCPNRRPVVAYPRHACRECGLIEQAERDMLAKCIAAATNWTVDEACDVDFNCDIDEWRSAAEFIADRMRDLLPKGDQ